MADLAAQLVVFVFAVFAVGIILGPAYKYRHHIKRWLKDEQYGSSFDPGRVKRAERHLVKAKWRMEDAEAQLVWERGKDQGQGESPEEPQEEP